MSFKIERTRIDGLVLINKLNHVDSRGSFSEIFKKSLFMEIGIPFNFVQDNQVYSLKNTLRGLHYQIHPFVQGKLVNVIDGKIFDVAVDLRQGSTTYGNWQSFILDSKENKMLYIPEGFAHGYSTMSNEALVSYKTTSEYSSDSESGIIWNDGDLAINWPTPEPILSPKDLLLPGFTDVSGKYVHEVEV